MIALFAWPLRAVFCRVFWLGLPFPAAHILYFLVWGSVHFFDWGFLLLLGIFLWFFLAAFAGCVFLFWVAGAQVRFRRGFGGVVLGFVSGVAGVLCVGAGLVLSAMLCWGGFFGVVFVFLGVWAVSWLVYVRVRLQAGLACCGASCVWCRFGYCHFGCCGVGLSFSARIRCVFVGRVCAWW
ncbi:YeeE/YedE thiosulfate transporter family protein [Escherichia coli]|uniref:YeeE/YedE thiosulfate transporter family protein n=1 Tax=Escherichia coli TaxID=562 RepID=UPI0009082DE8